MQIYIHVYTFILKQIDFLSVGSTLYAILFLYSNMHAVPLEAETDRCLYG